MIRNPPRIDATLWTRLPDSPGEGRIAYDVHLVGIAFAICYFKFGWRVSWFIPSFDGLSSWRRKLRNWRTRARLKVHDPESIMPESQLADEADRILAKLKAEGDQSLTNSERRLLEKYSVRLREKMRGKNQS